MKEQPPKFVDPRTESQMDAMEIRATVFMHDPFKYLLGFVQDLRQSEQNVSDIATNVIDEITSVCAYVEKPQQVKDLHLLDFLFADEALQRMRGLFNMLKNAGVTKQEMALWVNIETDEDNPEAKMLERAERVIMNEIYGE